jgi:hypothetical protein
VNSSGNPYANSRLSLINAAAAGTNAHQTGLFMNAANQYQNNIFMNDPHLGSAIRSNSLFPQRVGHGALQRDALDTFMQSHSYLGMDDAAAQEVHPFVYQ